jgi:hypothetical protein
MITPETANNLLLMLRELEWCCELVGDDDVFYTCPSCKANEPDHEAGCELAALLERADREAKS